MNFSRYEYKKGAGWISNKTTGEVITTDVDWIQISGDGDSLAVFASKGKRGYINRYSGEVAIAPQYDKAWIFSSGMAAVAKGNKVFFIDHSGKPINEKTFIYQPHNSYVYHGDYCIMNDGNNLQGLTDRSGNWEIEPKYEWICSAPRNYWMMRQGDRETGEIVTEPLYWNVEPIGKDLYHCKYKDSAVGVIVNSKGEITQS